MIRQIIATLVIVACAALAACTSTSPPLALDVVAPELQPAETVGDVSDSDSATTALAAEPAEQQSNTAATKVAALAPNANIRLAPVIGAPAGAVEAMNRTIAARSSQRGIGIVPSGAPGANYDMKGYFSAITESGNTTVIFVWDVFDTSGNRLHRIQGQESAPGSSPDGWSSVSSSVMENIGARTIDEFAAWLENRRNG